MLHIYAALAEKERAADLPTHQGKHWQPRRRAASRLGIRQEAGGGATRLPQPPRDADLEPTLRELSGTVLARAAAEIERRGLGKVSYKTIARARVRLGLKD